MFWIVAELMSLHSFNFLLFLSLFLSYAVHTRAAHLLLISFHWFISWSSKKTESIRWNNFFQFIFFFYFLQNMFRSSISPFKYTIVSDSADFFLGLFKDKLPVFAEYLDINEMKRNTNWRGQLDHISYTNKKVVVRMWFWVNVNAIIVL